MAKGKLGECESMLALSDLDLDKLYMLVLVGNITNGTHVTQKIVPETGPGSDKQLGLAMVYRPPTTVL